MSEPSFRFGRRDKVSKIHQELQISIVERECGLFFRFVLVFYGALGLTSAAFLVLRYFVELANEEELHSERVATDLIALALASCGALTSRTNTRALRSMNKSRILKTCRLLLVLGLCSAAYCLLCGFLFRAPYSSYSVGAPVYLLIVVFLSSIVFFVFFAYYEKMVSLAVNITTFYNKGAFEEAEYQNSMQGI